MITLSPGKLPPAEINLNTLELNVHYSYSYDVLYRGQAELAKTKQNKQVL